MKDEFSEKQSEKRMGLAPRLPSLDKLKRSDLITITPFVLRIIYRTRRTIKFVTMIGGVKEGGFCPPLFSFCSDGDTGHLWCLRPAESPK